MMSVFLLGGLSETELSAGLQQCHHHHISQQLLHGCLSLYGPVGGGFADPGGSIVPLYHQSDVWGVQQTRQGRTQPQRQERVHCPPLSVAAYTGSKRKDIYLIRQNLQL